MLLSLNECKFKSQFTYYHKVLYLFHFTVACGCLWLKLDHAPHSECICVSYLCNLDLRPLIGPRQLYLPEKSSWGFWGF